MIPARGRSASKRAVTESGFRKLGPGGGGGGRSTAVQMLRLAHAHPQKVFTNLPPLTAGAVLASLPYQANQQPNLPAAGHGDSHPRSGECPPDPERVGQLPVHFARCPEILAGEPRHRVKLLLCDIKHLQTTQHNICGEPRGGRATRTSRVGRGWGRPRTDLISGLVMEAAAQPLPFAACSTRAWSPSAV